jgi:hypothetical protein
VVTFFALLVVAALDHRFGWSRLPTPVVLIGNVLAALGLCIAMLVVVQTKYAAANITVEADQKVVTAAHHTTRCHPFPSCQPAERNMPGGTTRRNYEVRTDAFEEHRPHLRAVPYRMLGLLTEGDDAVWLRWVDGFSISSACGSPVAAGRLPPVRAQPSAGRRKSTGNGHRGIPGHHRGAQCRNHHARWNYTARQCFSAT